MTPRQMKKWIESEGYIVSITNTGGGCGALQLFLSGYEVLITPDDGPWATPSFDDLPIETDRWFMEAHPMDDELLGAWIDSDLVADGDATMPSDEVTEKLARLSWYLVNMNDDKGSV